jgi:gamma-glutamyltranspeptidase/glutathione hydrolase
MAKGFAVAAGSRLAAESAAEALRAGGTAVDAAVAGALAACVAEPVLASLLGGGFLMVRDPGGKTRLLDFFVQTPRRKPPEGEIDLHGITADFGTSAQGFLIGAGAIACPGVAPGLAEAHGRLGRLPFRDLAAPAIAAAGGGVALEPFHASVLKIILPIYKATPDARETFLGGAETAPEPGFIYRNPALADVLDAYAAEGPRFMQEGEPAAALAALCENGGALTREDLRQYAPLWREPETVRRGAARLALNPPPSTGGALIAFALALLGESPSPAEIARAFSATARARLAAGIDGDPEAGALRLADPAMVARFRREALASPFAPRGTTHISVVDGEGMAAALSLSNGEGCGLVVPGTGLMPNNMLGEADLVPEPNEWPTDRRLSSMMAPTVADWPDGRTVALGSGGSNRIRSAIGQVLLRVIDDRAPLHAAVEAPRLHVEGGKEPTLDFEDRFPERDREALLADWPEATVWPEDSMFFGGVHAVARDARGGTDAAADPRRGGAAIVG